MAHELSTYLWNAPATQAGRKSLAGRLAGIGCRRIWMKAGGDQGHAWIPGEPNPPSWLRAQWQTPWLDDLAPLEVLPWFYVWPEHGGEDEAIVRALRSHFAPTIALNPETEWRVQSAANSFDSLQEANGYAEHWVRSLKARLAQEFGRPVAVGFSSVPSWDDFPYEGFAAACDFAHPQHYWFPEALARREDQVAAHLRRVGDGQPCVPILAASREHNDDGVVRLAERAVQQFPGLAGLTAWEAGNASFQLDALGRSYAVLALLGTPPTPPPPATSRILAAWRALWAA